MRNETMATFKRIFQEAIVYDVDLSIWRKRVRIVAAAGAIGGRFSAEYCAMYYVDFLRPKHLELNFDLPEAHDRALGDALASWTVFDCAIVIEGRIMKLHLRRTGGPEPDMKIDCCGIDLVEFDPRPIRKFVNADFGLSSGGFARPSLEEIIKKLSRH
jgi:hypothetical protein